MKKAFLYGFLFGTIGLYILALLALVSPMVEQISNVLSIPGRFLAETFTGSEGSTLEVILFSIANGIIYGIIFSGIRMVFKK